MASPLESPPSARPHRPPHRRPRPTLLALSALLPLVGVGAAALLALPLVPPAAAGGGAGPERRSGALIVAGGGATVPEIARRALEAGGGAAGARVLIVPQASGDPGAGAASVDFWLEAGARTATSLDLSDPAAAEAAVRAATLIWIPGGDQVRLMRALGASGASRIAAAIAEQHRAGTAVGGTSAGAAALGAVMLTGDADLESITAGRTVTATGLGLWPGAIVDQHVLARRRLNRLIAAVLDHPHLLGIGVDESTAAIVIDGRLEVVGRGQVVVVDAREADVAATRSAEPSAGKGLGLHILRAGMSFGLGSRAVDGGAGDPAAAASAAAPGPVSAPGATKADPRAPGVDGAPAAPPVRDVGALLRPIRERHRIPGMVGAIVSGERTVAAGADGVRRRDSSEAVTLADRFHIGSCTKSMTATLIAMLVEEGKLSWTTTIGEQFPDLMESADPAWRGVTLEQLLTHRSGAPASLDADGLWARLWLRSGTPPEQRRALLEGVLRRPPEAAPGTRFIYANAGFAIAGAMAEGGASSREGREGVSPSRAGATGAAWEDLMRRRLFEPLGMSSAGFGAPGAAGTLDEPRGHTAGGRAVEPGPSADNPPAIGPAGTVHCSIGDWARYVALHLQGARGEGKLLRPESFRKLHEPAPGGPPSYAMGWGVASRDWAGGRVLTHNGSNTMWFCVTWIAPANDFAVLVACNQGGPEADKACDEASSALIQDHLSR